MWNINTDQGRPGIDRLKGRWLNSLTERRTEWSVLLWRLSKKRFDGHTKWVIFFLYFFIERPPSLGGKTLKCRRGGGVGDHYNIINRSNYSYHFNFPRLFLCLVWFVCFSYEPYFSQIKQLVCGTWEARLKSRPVTTSKGSLSKGKCHSVCLRPCLTPDDREVRLMIGKGNKNTAHLIIVT